MKKLIAALVVFLTPAFVFAQLVPQDRIYDWSKAGRVGGIPAQTQTIYTTINSTGDSTDRTSAINNAIAACPSGQVVKLGPGTFRINGVIYMRNETGVVLRGSGLNSTILDMRMSGAYGFVIGNTSIDYPYPSTGTNLSANEAQGQTVLSMSSTSAYNVGDRVTVFQQNSQTAAWPVISTSSEPSYDMGHVTKITGKDASTITILDPLPYAFTTAQGARVHVIADGFSYDCGLEDLTLNYANASVTCGLHLWNADNCWLKGVKISQPDNQNIWMLHSLHCTVTYSFLDRAGNGSPNGAGILMERSGSNLVYDNIIYQSFPNIEINFHSTCNVFAYNAIIDSIAGEGIDPNHGAHNAYNLFEGNVAPNLKPDGYFGSVSHDTALRNRFTGVDNISDTSGYYTAIDLKRFTRNYNIIGNIIGLSGGTYEATSSAAQGNIMYQLGYPNIGNTVYSGTAEPSSGDWWSNWPGGTELPTGFQERDLDVSNTLIRKGNFNTATGSIPAGESLGSYAIPNSYYLSTKPSWFYGLNWPPFDPTKPIINLTSSYEAIPAGYRYLHNLTDPAGGGGNSTGDVPSAPAQLRIIQTQ